MKPTYTVRLTEDLDAAERARVAERVAETTDIDASKFERLLERGKGKDLIRPSSAGVANRLASVLAEAGAPVLLVPSEAETEKPAEAQDTPSPSASEAVDVEADAVPDADAHAHMDADDADDAEVMRPRRETPEPAQPTTQSATPTPSETEATEPAPPETKPAASTPAETPPEAHAPAETTPEDVAPTAPESESSTPAARPSPPPSPAAEASLPEPEPADDVSGREDASPDPDVQAESPPAKPDRSPLDEPPPAPEPQGNGLLGAVGAALLGIGAFFGMSFLVDPLAIGILVLAVLALGLAFLGQRRATWLPGVGALALVVWAVANADEGVVATLAGQWEWYAMFAGSLLVIIAGWQESRQQRAP